MRGGQNKTHQNAAPEESWYFTTTEPLLSDIRPSFSHLQMVITFTLNFPYEKSCPEFSVGFKI